MNQRIRAPSTLAQLLLKKLHAHPEGIAGTELWKHVEVSYPGYTFADYVSALDLLRETGIAHCTNRTWWIRDAGAHTPRCTCETCLNGPKLSRW